MSDAKVKEIGKHLHFYIKIEKENGMIIPDHIQIEYIFGPVLGRGNFAVVRKCTVKHTGQEWAVKIINKAFLNPIRQQTEVEILSLVRHPNVVSLFKMAESTTHLFLFMELVTGGELLDEIEKRGFFSERDAAHIIYQIVAAIKYLHENNIVHRDLKPENLLIGHNKDPLSKGDLIVKIADFGLAKIVGADSILKTPCGTPSCVAPEVLLGGGYGKEVDLWGIGIILYILLSGTAPFGNDFETDENVAVLYEQIVNGSYNFPYEYWAGVSDEARNLVSLLLNVDPKQRYTADQVLNHSWMKRELIETEQETIQSRRFLSNMKEYNARRKLRAIVVSISTSKVPKYLEPGSTQMQMWQHMFDTYKDKSNRISVISLKKILSSLGLDIFDMKILSLRRHYPNEGVPVIDWENFLYLAMSLPPKLSLSQIKIAFNTFDKNKSGKISANELSQLCRDLAITEEEEKDIRSVVNMTQPDSKLDYQQFLTILTTRPEKLEI